jgi:hypothetical protein
MQGHWQQQIRQRLLLMASLQRVEQQSGQHASGRQLLVIFEAGDQAADRFFVVGGRDRGVNTRALQTASTAEFLRTRWQR